MLGFQNKALDSKLLKFHLNRDNSAYLEKYDFQWKLVCQLWDCHWIHGVETSSEVVSDLDFKSLLVLQAQWCKLKLAIFTVSLKKCKFLQVAPNIGNILIHTNFEFWRQLMREKWAVKVTAQTSNLLPRVSSHHQLDRPHRSIVAAGRRYSFGQNKAGAFRSRDHHAWPPAPTIMLATAPARGSTFWDPLNSAPGACWLWAAGDDGYSWPVWMTKGERRRSRALGWRPGGFNANLNWPHGQFWLAPFSFSFL